MESKKVVPSGEAADASFIRLRRRSVKIIEHEAVTVMIDKRSKIG